MKRLRILICNIRKIRRYKLCSCYLVLAGVLAVEAAPPVSSKITKLLLLPPFADFFTVDFLVDLLDVASMAAAAGVEVEEEGLGFLAVETGVENSTPLDLKNFRGVSVVRIILKITLT